MTVYTIDNTSKKNRPVRLFDANGEEVNYAVYCDTNTGKVKRYAHDGNKFILNEYGDAIKVIEETRPTPFRVENA